MTDDRPAAAPDLPMTLQGSSLYERAAEAYPEPFRSEVMASVRPIEREAQSSPIGDTTIEHRRERARPTPEPAPAHEALRDHTPTLWLNDPITPIHCSCGLKDHMAGWWAHIKVGVVERAAPADLLSVEDWIAAIKEMAVRGTEGHTPANDWITVAVVEAILRGTHPLSGRASSRGAPTP